MYFGQKDESKLEAFRRTLKGTVGSLIEGDLKKAEISRQKRDEAGVTAELDAYRSALTNATDPVTVFNATLQTTARLNRYGNLGAQAANQVYRVADLWKGMRPAPAVKPEPVKRAVVKPPTKYEGTLGRDVEYYEDDRLVKIDRQQLGKEPSESAGRAWGAVEQRQLNALLAKKDGLYKKIISKYNDKKGGITVDLDAILRGEKDVPDDPTAKKYADELDAEGFPTGNKVEVPVKDQDIIDWQKVIGETESLIRQKSEATNQPFVDAKTRALEKKYGPGSKGAPAPTPEPAPVPEPAALPFASEEEFANAFERKKGRPPSAKERQKAKGKYY